MNATTTYTVNPLAIRPRDKQVGYWSDREPRILASLARQQGALDNLLDILYPAHSGTTTTIERN